MDNTQPIQPQPPIINDIPADRSSIYSASYGNIVLKNFLAGFSRGLGNVAVQLIFFAITYYAFIHFAMPQLQPWLDMMQQTVQNLQKVQQTQSQLLNAQPSTTGGQSPQIDINQLLQQLQTPKE